MSNQKTAGVRLQPRGVTPSCTAPHGAGEHGQRLGHCVEGPDLPGFPGGAMGSSCCTCRAEAVSFPFRQLCRKPSLELCRAPGSSFRHEHPEAGASLRLRAGPPPHHTSEASPPHRSLPRFKCQSCTVGTRQQQNLVFSRVPYIGSALGRALLRRSTWLKRRCSHLGPALEESPQSRVCHRGCRAAGGQLGDSERCEPGSAGRGAATSTLLVCGVQGPVWIMQVLGPVCRSIWSAELRWLLSLHLPPGLQG